MNKLKISFLIPAHNEAKIIKKTLDNLVNLPYENYEVLIGLDGCTDKTEEIVKPFIKNLKFKYFNLKFREGKHKVVDFLVKKSKGDIIIIHDADWKFSVNSKHSLEKYLQVFKNKSVGGIAESFPVEYNQENLKHSNFWYKMIAYSHFYWFDFQKEKYTKKIENNILKLDVPLMFLTNVFKKNLYKSSFSLGDDFERTNDIMKEGYSIVLFNDLTYPRMISIYNNVSLKDFFKQKIRTSMARTQLSNSNKLQVSIKYYLDSLWFIFSKGWINKKGIYVTFWIFLTFFASIISKFMNIGTKSGWKLRAERR